MIYFDSDMSELNHHFPSTISAKFGGIWLFSIADDQLNVEKINHDKFQEIIEV
jgi:hypothetical protein